MGFEKREKRPEKRPLIEEKKNGKEYVVKEDSKLLEFLFANITGQSKNNIKQILHDHKILVNGKGTTQFDYLLKNGDIVTVSPVPVLESGKRVSKLPVIYEDDEFLAINKPSGLLSVEDNKEKDKTAYRIMSDYVKAENPHARLYVLHRIDKETSGVLIFTKNEKIKDALQEKWNQIVLVREYTAICEGTFKQKVGTISSYLTQGKNGLVYSTKNFKEGQLATTNYQVLEENGKLSLVNVALNTGRKNQIRVHMKELGHSVSGDVKYESKLNPLGRLCLHNRVLIFTHPINHKKYTFVAEAPKEFQKLFKK